MSKNKATTKVSLTNLVKPITSGKLKLPKGYRIPADHGHMDTFTTIREGTYRGKNIRVETVYKITLDGKPVTAHTTVLDDGSVHCHAFPNYSVPSAMQLARKLIEAEVPVPKDELGGGHDSHGGHGKHDRGKC